MDMTARQALWLERWGQYFRPEPASLPCKRPYNRAEAAAPHFAQGSRHRRLWLVRFWHRSISLQSKTRRAGTAMVKLPPLGETSNI